MGWEVVRMEVHGHVSRHNSPNDRLDDALWEHFVARVRDVAADPVYKSLDLDVLGGKD